MIQIFGWITQNLFRKVEFNCKVQLPTSDLFVCPKCTRPRSSVCSFEGFLLHSDSIGQPVSATDRAPRSTSALAVPMCALE